MTDFLVPGDTCWRIEQATRATVIVDADDYFRTARRAMVAATHQILLMGRAYVFLLLFGMVLQMIARRL